jgi:hypothetical protein
MHQAAGEVRMRGRSATYFGRTLNDPRGNGGIGRRAGLRILPHAKTAGYTRTQAAPLQMGSARKRASPRELQPQPLPGSCLPGYVRSRRSPRRKHRRLVYDWLIARAVEAIGPTATPCDYLCARLRNDGATSRNLPDECRAWICANRPGIAAATFPGRFYIDRYALRTLHGELGTPTAKRSRSRG